MGSVSKGSLGSQGGFPTDQGLQDRLDLPSTASCRLRHGMRHEESSRLSLITGRIPWRTRKSLGICDGGEAEMELLEAVILVRDVQ